MVYLCSLQLFGREWPPSPYRYSQKQSSRQALQGLAASSRARFEAAAETLKPSEASQGFGLLNPSAALRSATEAYFLKVLASELTQLK